MYDEKKKNGKPSKLQIKKGLHDGIIGLTIKMEMRQCGMKDSNQVIQNIAIWKIHSSGKEKGMEFTGLNSKCKQG